MVNPKVQVERDLKGSWNFANLLKGGAQPPKEISYESQQTPQKEIPGWLKKAGLSLSVQDAFIKVSDRKSQSDYDLNQVSLKTGLLSLEKLPSFALNATLNTKIGNTGEVKGPFEVLAEPQGEGLKLRADFKKLVIQWGDSFQKKADSPLSIQALIWRETDDYRMSINLPGFPIRGPFFKQSLELSGEAHLGKDKLEKAVLELKGKNFNCSLNASVESFSKPNLKVELISTQMDLDELIDWQAMKEASKSKQQSKTENSTQSVSPKQSSKYGLHCIFIHSFIKNSFKKKQTDKTNK
jgi:hypothetical protein